LQKEYKENNEKIGKASQKRIGKPLQQKLRKGRENPITNCNATPSRIRAIQKLMLAEFPLCIAILIHRSRKILSPIAAISLLPKSFKNLEACYPIFLWCGSRSDGVST